MSDIEFGEITEYHDLIDGTEQIISTVYANGDPSTVKTEIRKTEACRNKDEILKELLTAAGMVDTYGDIEITVKRGKVNKPYLVTTKWRTGYQRFN
jgi:hypothetical protein